MQLQPTETVEEGGEPAGQARVGPDVAMLHAQLLRFAKSKLRNVALAEDAVSETVLAALNLGPRFTSQSQARAWMFGVLRHKLVDELRQQGRESPSGDLAPELDTEDGAWRGAGFWCGGRAATDDPEQSCRQRQFLELLARCCDRLPPTQARAFIMWEVRGLEAGAICGQLDVTEPHLWVLLHRARQRMRDLLTPHWRPAPQPSLQPGTQNL
jgi:RNA polymerase sigma-70 factor (ECF subfamily)